MKQEQFIKRLDTRGYSYEIEGDKIIVTHKGYVDLKTLKSLPIGVEFNCDGPVDLRRLTSIPSGVVFRNGNNGNNAYIGDVYLQSLETIPPGVVFNNRGYVNLESLTSIPPGIVFNNRGSVYINGWRGSIEGVGSNRLLNFMISKGLFER
jgi:hypothetical protein